MDLQLLPINYLSVQVKQVPIKVEQQKSVCLSMGSLDWKTLQRNRIEKPDLLPTGFLYPLLAVGSSQKPKGALYNLHQNLSLLW